MTLPVPRAPHVRIATRERGAPGRLTRWHRPGLALLSAALLTLAFEPVGLAPLAWAALVPFLIAITNTTPFATRGLCFVFGVAFYAMNLWWFWSIFGPASIALYAILAFSLWVFGFAFVAVQSRFGAVGALLWAPVLWLGLDLFRCEVWFFRFSWLQLGFTQARSPWVLQFAALGGVYGLTFLILLANAFLAAVVLRRGLRPALAVCALAPAAAWLVGLMPARERGAEKGSLAACAVQTETSHDEALDLTDAMEASPDLIVWPEYAVMDFPLDDPELLGMLAARARERQAHLVVGCKERIPGRDPEREFRNAALILSPAGEVVGSYHKHHPIQFFRDGVPGEGYPVYDLGEVKVGIAICYDFDFAHLSRGLVRNGAEVLLVPTYDEMAWGALQHRQHSAMTLARAVEHRRWVVRPTSSGETQIVDPYGVVRANVPIGETGVALASVEPLRRLTLYDRVGFVAPYLCLLCSAAWVLIGLTALVRRGPRSHSTGAASVRP